MKLLTSLLCLVISTASSLAADIQQPHVTVFGTASIKAKPDLQRWSVTVATLAGDVAAVSDTHADRAAAVLKLLKKNGIAPADLQTAAVSLSENRVYRDNSWLKEGYRAETSIAFTLRDPAKNRDIWLGLSRLQDVSVNNVTWDIADRIPLQDRARAEALTAAKAKAQQLATGLATRLAEPLAIEEIPTEPERFPGSNVTFKSKAPMNQSGEDSAAPGELTVQARVQVTFRLVSP